MDDINHAIKHIQQYSSHHTDIIITEDTKAAQRFSNEVDSAIVMHNTSTQFADGGKFGMGAGIGIATGKLHARGAVGVEQLTTFKYLVCSNGVTLSNLWGLTIVCRSRSIATISILAIKVEEDSPTLLTA